MMTPEEIAAKIAALEAQKRQVELQATAQINYLDGQIAALKEVLQPPEIPPTMP